MNTPIVSEVREGLKIQCPDCTFSFVSQFEDAPMVHICGTHKVVRWHGTAVLGRKTNPPKIVATKPKTGRR